MNTIEQSTQYLTNGLSVAQGDVTLRTVEKIPDGLCKQAPVDNKLIIAHSETGHHHAIDYSDAIDVYDQDEFVSYIHNRSDNVIVLKHHRSFHTHSPVGIPPNSKVKIIRQREYIPQGWRRAAD